MFMEMYWSRYKVYFFGKFALFPESYTDVEFKYNDFNAFIAYHNIEQLVAELKEYEKSGYFNVSIRFSSEYITNEIAKNKMSYSVTLMPGRSVHRIKENYGLGNAINAVKDNMPLSGKELSFLLDTIPIDEIKRYLKFTVSNINIEKFKNELVYYLKKYQKNELTTRGPTKPEVYENQSSRLFIAMQKNYSAQRLRPIISYSDIWSNNNNDVALHTFWELLLTQHLILHKARILNMGYKNELAHKKYNGILRSDSLLVSPYAEIEIIDENTVAILSNRHAQTTIQTPKVIYPNHIANSTSNDYRGEHTTASVRMIDGNVTFVLSSGGNIHLTHLRTDSQKYNFMNYMLIHPDERIGRAKIQTEATGCKSVKNLRAMITRIGFNKNLKTLFFPDSSPQQAILKQNVTVDKNTLESFIINKTK